MKTVYPPTNKVCGGGGGYKKGKIEKEGKKYLSTLVLFTWLSSLCIQYLKTVAIKDAELIRWKKMERKKNGQITGLISHMWLIL